MTPPFEHAPTVAPQSSSPRDRKRGEGTCSRCGGKIEFTNIDVNQQFEVICTNQFRGITCGHKENAFRLFYNRYYRLAVWSCGRQLNNHEDAKETADDVFLDVY